MKKFFFTLCVLGCFASCQKEIQQTSGNSSSIQQQEDNQAQLTGGRPFEVMLTGAAERPGPGDPDGRDKARFDSTSALPTLLFLLWVLIFMLAVQMNPVL